ncbi:uncharacterized protein B0T15DRAFT_542640 [Chaetomium strumarium]|uniref:Uncharacterized protein n=1 Tax=Chaetomium strumarium TaxID=1170767 RepID=A0AAJ0LYG8_9PEZI|nr:hypothetical protein B0T15DRAFT_542640 [Chaetomium strumarium]
MLDENLPTFRLKPSSDNPLSSILYFTHNGSEPAAEYLLRRADPALPESRNKYAIALCDPHNAGVVYGEVTVEPEWSQPTLSAAEIRAQSQAGAPPAAAVATVPDSFTVQLYNPDQSVTVKMVPGSWGKSDSWEFELPVQTFATPTASELDREQQNSSPAAADLIPRVMFRWKRDGLISKDMTCYVSGMRLGARKNKEPDITVALFKASRESILTVYQPNWHRVEIEDRKGLELVLLLGSEVIKEFWLTPKLDLFNIQGVPPTLNGNKRKNSRPVAVANNSATTTTTTTPTPTAMSGALANAAPSQPPPPTSAPTKRNTTAGPSTTSPGVDAETRRLQAMVEREQREREKAERAEQKRIKKMIEEEEKERRRREAEVAKETERLRKMYGVEGQELPKDRPPLPPRQQQQQQQGPPPPHASHPPHHPPPPPQQHLNPWGYRPPTGGPGSGFAAPPVPTPTPGLPPRPVSAGPYDRPGQPSGQQQQQQQQGPFHFNTLNALWKGAAGQLQQLQSQVPAVQRHGRRRSEEERSKIQKKRSSHW